MLWLNQRHALKAFRASVGDVEGHDSFVSDSLFLDTELIDKMIRKCQDWAQFKQSIVIILKQRSRFSAKRRS